MKLTSSKRRKRLISALVAIAAGMSGLVNTPALAADFSPTTTSELEEAVALANSNGADDTINLNGTDFVLVESLTIGPDGGHSITFQGPGTLNGNESVRVLFIEDGANLTLEGVTVQNGLADDGSSDDDGGGIYNDGGTLNITSSTVKNNVADDLGGGIYNDGGTLNITSSTITENGASEDGGGIYAVDTESTITIEMSTVSSNDSDSRGGGIYLDEGKLDLISSAVWDNTGLAVGGITNASGMLDITSSTISGNEGVGNGSVVGAISNLEGTVTVTSSTISANEGDAGYVGGLANIGGSVSIKASIVAGNVGGGNADCLSVVSNDYNVVGIGCPANHPNDTTDDPMLGDLADNGGSTLTHAITTDSPAFDRHSVSDVVCPGTTDQIGTARPQGEHCDSGAFEVVTQPLSITKSPESQTVVSGDDASFEIMVTNEGDETVEAVTVTDETVPACAVSVGNLTSGADHTYTCTAAGVTEDFTNTATVSGTLDEEQVTATSNEAVVEVLNPSLSIAKTPPSQTIVSGGDAEFTITVTNTGDTALDDVTVEDATVPACDAEIGTLAAADGEASDDDVNTYMCTAEDLESDIVNTAGVSGTEPVTGTEVTASSGQATVNVLHPSVSITKSPETQEVISGGDAEFTITVTNTGDAALDNVAVTDATVPDCDRIIDELAASGNTAYTCTASDITEDFTNTATVSGVEPVTQTEVSAISNQVVVEVTECTITGSGSIKGTSGDDIICGSDGLDIIYGNGGDDVIIAGDGNDRIYGGAGNDQIFGGAGNDYIYGQDGEDALFGESGNDRLYGGDHDDSLNGGAGTDTCHGQSGNDERESCEAGSG
ncbi:MAG: choice-of-anchor Q domain-containing protein [Actinomycetota bacterium]